MHTTWSIVAALLSAAFFAFGAALQHREVLADASLTRSQRSRWYSWIVTIVKKPLWLLGIALDGTGVALQAFAVTVGSLSVVQPLLLLGLVMALPISAMLDNRRARRREIVWAICLTASLAALFALARPTAGDAKVGLHAWLYVALTAAVVVFPVAVTWTRLSNRVRCWILAVACGALFAVTAGLTKVVGNQLHEGPLSVLAMWQVYAVAIVGSVGFAANQYGFRLGPLAWTLPAMSAAEPAVSVALGALMFDEHMSGGLVRTPVQCILISTALVSAVKLATGKAVHETE